jgi:hypothetical protein
MSYKNRYTIRSMPRELGESVLASWKCIKFDRDHEVEGIYVINKIYSPTAPNASILTCGCFAGNKETCRHRQMVEVFDVTHRIDSGWTFDFDKKRWYEPLTNGDI